MKSNPWRQNFTARSFQLLQTWDLEAKNMKEGWEERDGYKFEGSTRWFFKYFVKKGEREEPGISDGSPYSYQLVKSPYKFSDLSAYFPTNVKAKEIVN